jgi:cellulose synthase/poly-beta-1,6-N-acetylglucosamine synthase-like glycosyltransferase
MQAIYINLLQTYAFANLHDLTWVGASHFRAGFN